MGNEFQIAASDGALIQYFAGFDIPAGDRADSAGSDATVINEIFTIVLATSQIDGNLFANGKWCSSIRTSSSEKLPWLRWVSRTCGTDLALPIWIFLGGAVTAAGSITAGRSFWRHLGYSFRTILVGGGTLVMAGAGMQLTNEDNSDS